MSRNCSAAPRRKHPGPKNSPQTGAASMPRKRRKENEGLPARWVSEHGAYFYQVPAGLEDRWDGKRKFRLGASLPEAYAEWARRLEDVDGAKTIGALLDRYAL